MDLKKKIIHSYKWNVIGNLIVRSLGVVSTLILVRLLMPEDFGLIAIALMVIGLFDVMTNMGVNRYLLFTENPSDDTYHSAWTLNILFRSLAALLLLTCAPFIADFLQSPEVSTVIRILTVVKVAEMFTNIGMVSYQKAVNFKIENQIKIGAKVVAFIATITSAYYFQNYYALAIGQAVQAISSTVLSYVVCPFRPKLRFHFESEMFRFSAQIFLRNIVSFSRAQIDVLLVGKQYGDTATGQFKVARDFALMPQSELMGPALGPSVAGLVSLKSDRTHFMEKLYQLLFFSWFVTFPCALGLMAVANDFTFIVLGEKWMGVAPFIGILGFLMLPFVTQPLLFIGYDSFGHTRFGIVNDLFALALLIAAFLMLVPVDVVQFSQMRAVVGGIAFAFMLLMANRLFALSVFRVILLLLMILVPALLMYESVIYLQRLLIAEHAMVRLFLCVGVGVVIYGVLSFVFAIVVFKQFRTSFLYRVYPEEVFRICKACRLI